jgi:DNA primase
VEGPFNVLALRQWDVPALALCGTGQSVEALSLLERWQRVYAVLDGDAAGYEATALLVQLLGPRVIPLELPPGINDPAELACRADGQELFQAAIRDAFDSHRSTAVRGAESGA